MKYYAYEDAEGVKIVTALGATREDGWIEIDANTIPPKSERHLWAISGGKIVINPDKKVPTEKTHELRRLGYPPIGDQLDAIMKWLATETEFTVPKELKSIAMKCMSVKAQNPIKD